MQLIDIPPLEGLGVRESPRLPTALPDSSRAPVPQARERFVVGRIAARTSRGVVLLGIDEVLAFEAQGRLHFVHSAHGRFDLDVSLLELEKLLAGAFLRVHRNWLVPFGKVRHFERRDRSWCVQVESRRGGPHSLLCVPVSKELRASVRRRLLAGAIGLRSPGPTG